MSDPFLEFLDQPEEKVMTKTDVYKCVITSVKYMDYGVPKIRVSVKTEDGESLFFEVFYKKKNSEEIDLKVKQLIMLLLRSDKALLERAKEIERNSQNPPIPPTFLALRERAVDLPVIIEVEAIPKDVNGKRYFTHYIRSIKRAE